MSDTAYYLPLDLGPSLADFRKATNFTQAQIAQQLDVDQSRISRIEKGDITPSTNELEGYLKALRTEDALEYMEFLKQSWEMTERPPYNHPERKALQQAELYMQKVGDFIDQTDGSRLLIKNARWYQDLLREEVEYLRDLSHSISYIGEIGVGKTTALCQQIGLVLPNSTKKPVLQKKIVLETGTGRTTVCEVRIRNSQKCGIIVEPLSEPDIDKLVRDLCSYHFGIAQQDQLNQQAFFSEEIERALLNMAFPPNTEATQDEIDPWSKKINECDNVEALRLEFSSRLNLSERTQTEIWYFETSKQTELEWLQKTFKDINNGLHKAFSLPKSIEIVIPYKILESKSYNLTLVDTKGIDQQGTAIRPDLDPHFRNKRTLTVLCSRFDHAPAPSILDLLNNLIETGSEQVLQERVIILILPRFDEACNMKDPQTREEVEEEEEGYKLKRQEVERALQRIGCHDIPILFFNAQSSDNKEINNFLLKKINDIRETHINQIRQIATGIDDLLTNQDKHSAEAAQKEVKKQLKNFSMQHQQLQSSQQPIYNYLLDKINVAHPNTIWATTTRSGTWDNLHVYFLLGNGAKADAQNRSQEIFIGLKAVIQQMLADDELKTAHNFLSLFLKQLYVWRDDFLKSAQEAGKAAFKDRLENDLVWKECAKEYGQGSGFRNKVIEHLKNWFEDPQHQDLHDVLTQHIENKWSDQLEKLIRRL